MNRLGLDVNSVGNHEFDEGATELLRMQNGGCRSDDPRPDCAFAGADFRFLAANVVRESNGRTRSTRSCPPCAGRACGRSWR
jgi:5'-nucleotidase